MGKIKTHTLPNGKSLVDKYAYLSDLSNLTTKKVINSENKAFDKYFATSQHFQNRIVNVSKVIPTNFRN